MISRGDIIREGLDRAGRPDLVSEARLWLNLFLEEQYNNQDWSWLLKTQPSLAVVQGGTLPSDYRSAKTARINDFRSDFTIVSDQALIVTEDPAEYDHYKYVQGRGDGVPQYMYIDRAARTYEFTPNPMPGMSFTLSYYFLPTLPDHNDPTTDAEIPVWELPAKILTTHIKACAHDYNDDVRQDKAYQAVEKMILQAKMNDHDQRAGRKRMVMGKSFKKRF